MFQVSWTTILSHEFLAAQHAPYQSQYFYTVLIAIWYAAAIIQAIEQHRPKIVFLTSPNNPDGSLIQEAELTAILDQPVLVVLDEAYIEFADEPSRLDWVQKYGNLVVLRTFSKSAGLAGIRVGYGSFPLGMIEYLWRAKQPYNVSVASEVAACAALSNMTYLQVRCHLSCFDLVDQVDLSSCCCECKR